MKVQVWSMGLIEVKPEVQKHIARCQQKQLCFACEEKLEGNVVRHTHENCYRALMRAVARGDESLDGLVKNGLMAAKADVGRKPTHKALRRIRSAKIDAQALVVCSCIALATAFVLAVA